MKRYWLVILECCGIQFTIRRNDKGVLFVTFDYGEVRMCVDCLRTMNDITNELIAGCGIQSVSGQSVKAVIMRM